MPKAAEEAYNGIWQEQNITLQKGMNIFYINGDSGECRMHFEITGLEKASVTYVGAYTRDWAEEQIKEECIRSGQ